MVLTVSNINNIADFIHKTATDSEVMFDEETGPMKLCEQFHSFMIRNNAYDKQKCLYTFGDKEVTKVYVHQCLLRVYVWWPCAKRNKLMYEGKEFDKDKLNRWISFLHTWRLCRAEEYEGFDRETILSTMSSRQQSCTVNNLDWSQELEKAVKSVFCGKISLQGATLVTENDSFFAMHEPLSKNVPKGEVIVGCGKKTFRISARGDIELVKDHSLYYPGVERDPHATRLVLYDNEQKTKYEDYEKTPQMQKAIVDILCREIVTRCLVSATYYIETHVWFDEKGNDQFVEDPLQLLLPEYKNGCEKCRKVSFSSPDQLASYVCVYGDEKCPKSGKANERKRRKLPTYDERVLEKAS